MNRYIGTVAYMGGVPAVLEKFAWAWGQLIQYTNEWLPDGEMIYWDRAMLSEHAAARNSLCDRMKGDFILMLDTDHEFEPDLLLRLYTRMMDYNLDVLSGVYCWKNPPHAPVIFHEGDNGFFQNIGTWEGAPLIQVDSAGGGCLMIRRRVIEKIKTELNESPFMNSPPFGEDHSFFRRCKRLGIKAYCDTRIEASHLAVKPITLADRQLNYLGERIATGGIGG